MGDVVGQIKIEAGCNKESTINEAKEGALTRISFPVQLINGIVITKTFIKS